MYIYMYKSPIQGLILWIPSQASRMLMLNSQTRGSLTDPAGLSCRKHVLTKVDLDLQHTQCSEDSAIRGHRQMFATQGSQHMQIQTSHGPYANLEPLQDYYVASLHRLGKVIIIHNIVRIGPLL